MALIKVQSEGINLADDFTFSGTVAGAGEPSDYVLLATTTASSSASVSFDGYFSATFDNYVVYIYDLFPITNTVSLRGRFRRSNADVTTSNYSQSMMAQQNNGYDGGTGVSQSSFDLSQGANIRNTSTDNNCRVLTIFNPLSTTTYKVTSYYGWSIRNDGNIFTHSASGRLSDATTALSGISFFMSSGNLTGKFKLYGIK